MSNPKPTRKSRTDPGQPDQVLAQALSDFRLDPKRSYTAQVYDALQQAILQGAIPPRTSLSEASISSILNVSRTPAREALAQLAEDQLVVIYRQVGSVVAPIRMSLIEEGRFVRSTLECANHVQLALSITPEQLVEFGHIVDQQRQAVATGDRIRFFELDELMHRRLFEFAGRDHVWPMLEPMKRHFNRVRWLLLDHVSGHAERALKEHEQMLAQMAARDLAGLGASVAMHINHISEHLSALRTHSPASYFAD